LPEYFNLFESIPRTGLVLLSWVFMTALTTFVCYIKRKSPISFDEILVIMAGYAGIGLSFGTGLKAIFSEELQQLLGNGIWILGIGVLTAIRISFSNIKAIFNQTKENSEQ